MLFEYETERLSMRVLYPENVNMVLDFYLKYHESFDKWEAERTKEFFTKGYHEATLNAELAHFMKGKHARFYLFEKSNDKKIIGSVSFTNVLYGSERSCKIGYKLIPEYQHKGYATEAISELLKIMHKEWGIHRVEADIMTLNVPSQRLIERLGFSFEGVAVSSHCVRGIWMDHNRYAYIFND